MSVSDWQELESWYSHVQSLKQGQVSSGGLDSSTAFTIQYDIDQLRYIWMFDSVGEWVYGSMHV